MRRILVEMARRSLRVRHGGGLERVDLDDVESPGGVREDQRVAVTEALARLEREDPRKAEVVRLRYFVGMTNRETDEATLRHEDERLLAADLKRHLDNEPVIARPPSFG